MYGLTEGRRPAVFRPGPIICAEAGDAVTAAPTRRATTIPARAAVFETIAVA
jgi:hypothetical protein